MGMWFYMFLICCYDFSVCSGISSLRSRVEIFRDEEVVERLLLSWTCLLGKSEKSQLGDMLEFSALFITEFV